MSIEIRWLGHSCFRVQCGDYAIVLDPFEPGSVPGLAPVSETADQVLCSHDHHDHGYRRAVTLSEEKKESPFTVTALPSFHDDKEGELRGKNIIHLMKAEGLRIAHFGDVGCMPAPEILEQLKGLDAAMIPVGGHYTVDPAGAKAIVDAIEPRVVIPMHYRSDTFGFDVIGPVEDYLDLCGRWVRYDSDTISITPGMTRHTAVLTYSGRKD